MTTTLTLDADVAARLQALAKQRGISLNEAVNAAIRAGLMHDQRRKRRFVQKTASLGSVQYFDSDKALAAADELGDEELARRIARRK